MGENDILVTPNDWNPETDGPLPENCSCFEEEEIETTVETSTSHIAVNSPATADANDIFIWTSLFVWAAVAICVLLKKRHK